MTIQLNDDEYKRIARYEQRLQAIQAELKKLLENNAEIVDVLNTAWRDAYRRAKLEDDSLKDVNIPNLIDANGTRLVKIDTDRTGSWQEQLQE